MRRRAALNRIQSKARCHHTQRAATTAWRLLQDQYSQAELFRLRIAWEHALADEGPAELDEVCGELLESQYTERRVTGCGCAVLYRPGWGGGVLKAKPGCLVHNTRRTT